MTVDSTLEHELARRVVRLVAPPPEFTVSQWADAERRLSPESSAEPGRWNTDRAPYQRGIMDAVQEPGLQRLVIKSSSQVGKTEIILNLIGYFIHHDPAPMLVVQPTLELAEAFSKDRLAPMIRDTPALADRIRDIKSRNTGNTLLHKKFPGGHITLAGANSPASLASRPIRIVLCDETDRYPFSAGTEGDPIKLVQKRATTFWNRLFIEFSTPTIEGISRVQQSYDESDQRSYHVPCPLCEGLQVLSFSSIKWEKDEKGQPINVRCTCSHCGKDFDDSRKDWQLLNGKWIAAAPFTGTAGFHLNELYSPWKRWAEVVADFLDCEKTPEKLKVFVNTSLGETWKEKGDVPEWKRIYERRETFPLNQVPQAAYFLTAAADVQKDRIEVEIVAWGRDKQSWSIDYRVFQGDTATDGPWTQMDALLAESWPHECGVTMQIRMLAVDSGYNTQRVYNWARMYPRTRVMAVDGRDNSSVMLGQPSPVDVTVSGKRIRRGFRIWPVGVSMIKSELYTWLRLDKPVEGEPFPAGYCHFPEYGQHYFEMLTAEQLVAKVHRGFKRYFWEKIRERNEALDCRVYNRAAAAAVGLDRLNSSQWDVLASELGIPAQPVPAPRAEPAKPARTGSPAAPAPAGTLKRRKSSFL